VPGQTPTLRRPGLFAVLAAEVVSTVGTTLTALALPWFVLTTSHSPARSGFVMAAETAPVLLFGLVSGSWVERTGARAWMVLSDSCRAPLVAAIPILSAFGALPFWLLLTLVFMIGTFTVPYGTSQQMLLVDAVGDEPQALAQATSVLQAATRFTMLLGPPLAGLLIAIIGARAVLFIDAASYVVVVAIIAIKAPRGAPAEAARPGRLLDGITALTRDSVLANWSLATVIGEAAYQALFLAVPILVYTVYRDSATVVGLLLGAFGAGALTGSLLASVIAARLPPVQLSAVGKALQALLFCGLIMDLGPRPVGVLLTLLGIANGLVNGPSFAIRLARIPVEVRPRALAVMTAGTMLGATVGLALTGPAFETFSTTTVFAVLAALQIVSAAMFVNGARQAGERVPAAAYRSRS
jgi:MFS family permease